MIKIFWDMTPSLGLVPDPSKLWEYGATETSGTIYLTISRNIPKD